MQVAVNVCFMKRKGPYRKSRYWTQKKFVTSETLCGGDGKQENIVIESVYDILVLDNLDGGQTEACAG